MNDARGGAVPAARASSGSEADPGEEEQILEAIASGERQLALSLCVRHHAARVGRLCLSLLGSAPDADDVLQETLLTAHQSFGEFDGRGSVRAWLCGIARNKCLKLLEKKRRRGARLRLVTEPEAATPVDEVVSARRRAREVGELLEHVPPSDRDLLLLRYCAELSFAEVARVCGVTEPTARKRASRALGRLRGVLERQTSSEPEKGQRDD